MFSINKSELNRVTAESNAPFMTQLANFFFKLIFIIKWQILLYLKSQLKQLFFLAQFDRKHYIITSYITKFPLMSSKYLYYLSFFKGLCFLGKG